MCISPENNGHPRGHREKSDRSYRADQWMRNQCVQTVLCAGTAAGQTGKHEKRISVGRYLMQFQSGIGCNTRLTGGKEENYFDPPNAVRSQMWTIFRSLIQKINELRKSLTLFVVFFFPFLLLLFSFRCRPLCPRLMEPPKDLLLHRIQMFSIHVTSNWPCGEN